MSVVAFPKGQLSNADRQRLKKGGVVWVEIDDPGSMQALDATALIPRDALLKAAMTALYELRSARGSIIFLDNLAQSLKEENVHEMVE